MTEVIVNGFDNNCEVFNGQIRADGDGRIVMIIKDERYTTYGPNDKETRALVLRESARGIVEKFNTVPMIFESDAEIIEQYPLELSATITIEGGR